MSYEEWLFFFLIFCNLKRMLPDFNNIHIVKSRNYSGHFPVFPCFSNFSGVCLSFDSDFPFCLVFKSAEKPQR